MLVHGQPPFFSNAKGEFWKEVFQNLEGKLIAALNTCHLIINSSFFFDSVLLDDIECKILSIPRKKLIVSTHVQSIFYPALSILYLACCRHTAVQKGVFPPKLKQAKVIPVYKSNDDSELCKKLLTNITALHS